MTEISVEQAATVDVKQMTKVERRELRRIIKRRFRMLREQLGRRERELSRALAQQVQEEKAASVAKISAKLKPLVERQNKLAETYSSVYEEAARLGVHIDLPTTNQIVALDELKARYGRDPVRAITTDEVQERMAAIREEAGWGKLNLNELEWQLDEQLAVGELESGTAQDFLAALPTVETLLPLPAGITLPELEQGHSTSV